jgi:AraC-like DNA-binding protein
MGEKSGVRALAIARRDDAGPQLLGFAPMSDTGSVDWDRWYTSLQTVALVSRDERLRRARAFIDANFGQSIDLDAIAQSAFLSRYHFLRQFRRAYDVTPHQYLMRRRVEAARKMLVTTDRSIIDICMDVGFHSLGSFSTLFRRQIGQPPARYRSRWVQCPGIPRPLEGTIPACFLLAFGN